MANIKDIYYRPSLAPVVAQCCSAMYKAKSEIRIIEESGIPAKLGNAVHKIFAEKITVNLPVEKAYMEEIAAEFGVTVEGYSGIGWRVIKTIKAWEKVAHFFPQESMEREKKIGVKLPNGFMWEGTSDLLAMHPGWGIVLDLKTGMKELDHEPQIKDYATIAAAKTIGTESMIAIIFNPIQDVWESYEYSKEELRAHAEELQIKMEKSGYEYTKGRMCEYCPRWTSCPAITQELLPSLEGIQASEGKEITTETIRTWYPIVKTMERIVERFKEAQKILLNDEGPIDLGDGYELFLRQYSKDDIKGPIAFQYLLSKEIPHDDILEKVKLSKSAIEEFAKTKAIPRSREFGIGKMKQMFVDELREMGGIEEKEFLAINTRPKRDYVPGKN